MPPTDGPVRPGDRLRISATTWNDIQETVRTVKSSRLGRTGEDGRADAVQPSHTLLIQNDSGGALSVGASLAIGDALVTVGADFGDQPCFSADVPAAVTDPVCVLVEPIADGAVGRAVVQGVAVATVSVSDVDHRFAVPTTAGAYLVSATNGPVRILSTPAGTGDQTVAVQLIGVSPAVAGTFTGQGTDQAITFTGSTFEAISFGDPSDPYGGLYTNWFTGMDEGGTFIIPADGYYLILTHGTLALDAYSATDPVNISVANSFYTNLLATCEAIHAGDSSGQFLLAGVFYLLDGEAYRPFMTGGGSGINGVDVTINIRSSIVRLDTLGEGLGSGGGGGGSSSPFTSYASVVRFGSV